MKSTVELICTKRDGGALDDDEIAWLLNAYLAGDVADEQMSALLMAIVWRGLNAAELVAWTDQMVASGDRLDLSVLSRPTVDKHSTGGVGDKISLILAPLVASCGVAVPQLSGRGLGHTGGTLDKLEAIPGWRASLSTTEFLDQLDDIGAVICAAGDRLAPADRAIYSLRDVTGTVESIPLISASIMSKKVAEGTDGLVLDVKVGRGAFMHTVAEARVLAATMVGLGVRGGVSTVARLTGMDVPLGRAVGNAVEVLEAIEVLQGGGPADVRELTLSLARDMIALAGVDIDPVAHLDNGTAYQLYRSMISAQGGDPDAELTLGRHQSTVHAPRAGTVSVLDARAIGVAACRLGAGRVRKEDSVSAGAGLRCLVRQGDIVEAGQPLFDVFADDAAHLIEGVDLLHQAYALGDSTGPAQPLLIERIGPDDVAGILGEVREDL